MKRIFFLLLVVSLHVPETYACNTTCTGSSLNIITNCCAICDGNPHPERPYPSPCDQATDDTCSINLALDAVGAVGGGEVIIPPGTCIISPSNTQFLHLYSNLTIRGSGPKSALKVADLQPPQTTRDYTAIFQANGCPTGCPPSLSNVTFKDFHVDQNVSHNLVSTNSLGGAFHYVIYPGALSPTVTVQTTGFTISGMVFDETDSSSTISLVNTDYRVPLQATITNDYFHFVRNGVQNPDPNAAPYDVSTVIIEGSQQVITGNTFIFTFTPNNPNLVGAPNGAIETLSGRNVIANNTITNYNTAVLALPSYYTCLRDTSACETATPATVVAPNETVIANNSVTCAASGIQIWPTTGVTLRNLSITGNAIDVCNMTRTPSTLPSTGVGYSGIKTVWFPADVTPPIKEARGYMGDVDGLTISDNIITMQKDDRSYGNFNGAHAYTSGILLYQIGNLANVLIKGNIIKDGPVAGIRVEAFPSPHFPQPPGSPSVSRLRILDNIIVDAGNDLGVFAADQIYRQAIGIFNIVKDVDIARNMIYDTATRSGNQLWGKYGLYLPSSAAFSQNIRTSQNTVRTNAAASLLSPQGAAGLRDATNASDVLISQIQGSTTSLSVDFISFTQYITTINNNNGALLVRSPPVNVGAQSAQWAVGQVVTFRFLCALTSSQTCTVTFDPPYSGVAEGSGNGSLLITGGTGRAITFQVENRATDAAPHKFFELYRSPTGVPNP